MALSSSVKDYLISPIVRVGLWNTFGFNVMFFALLTDRNYAKSSAYLSYFSMPNVLTIVWLFTFWFNGVSYENIEESAMLLLGIQFDLENATD
jgi:hypothetical protein